MRRLKFTSDKNNKGIAIIISLFMLTIFFILSFGFLSTVMSAKDAARVRVPTQSANLTTYEYVYNEALLGLNYLGEDTNGNISPAVDWSRFSNISFVDKDNSGTKILRYLGFATKSEDNSNASKDNGSGGLLLEDGLRLLLNESNDSLDFYIDTNTAADRNPTWDTTGWIKNQDLDGDGNDDYYSWMILESNGLDMNYIGGKLDHSSSPGTLDSNTAYRRIGRQIKELDYTYFDTANLRLSTVDRYADWSTDPPTIWDGKQKMIEHETTHYEKVAQSFYVGTTPISMKDFTTDSNMYDLSQMNLTATTYQDVYQAIDWLENSSDTTIAKTIAANIKDFCDTDNEAEEWTDGGITIVGNERVPYINEIIVGIENKTPTSDGTIATPNTYELNIYVEFVKMFYDASYNTWTARDNGSSGSNPNGSSAVCTVEGEVNFTRGTLPSISAPFSISTTFDISDTSNGYYVLAMPANNLTNGTDTTDGHWSNVTITIDTVTFEGQAGVLWDKVILNKTSTVKSELRSSDADPSSSMQYVGTNVSDPRVNTDDTNWGMKLKDSSDLMDFSSDIFDVASVVDGAWGSTQTSTVFDNDDLDISAWQDEEISTSRLWTISTAYMPTRIIQFRSELGFVSRGIPGETLNLTDYNIANPSSFVAGRYKPTATLDLSSTNTTFDGGDRALLDFVYLSLPNSSSSTADKEVKINDFQTGAHADFTYTNQQNPGTYKQFGIINPNTTDGNVLEILLYGSSTHFGPDRDKTNLVTTSILDKFIYRFPGMQSPLDREDTFNPDDFNDSTSNYHNRNPKTFGYIFSTMHPNEASDQFNGTIAPIITDAEREAMTFNSMCLVSPKYSYYTIVGAVVLDPTDPSPTRKSLYAFVRRDNESGSIKTIQKK